MRQLSPRLAIDSSP